MNTACMRLCVRRQVRGFTTDDNYRTCKSNSLPRQGALHREDRELFDASWTVREPLAGFSRITLKSVYTTGDRFGRATGEQNRGRNVRPACLNTSACNNAVRFTRPTIEGEQGSQWRRLPYACQRSETPKGAIAYDEQTVPGLRGGLLAQPLRCYHLPLAASIMQ